MVINRQDNLRIDVAGARAFAARLGVELKLGARHFNVCLVDDDAIRELNGAFRNKPQATDVLSFAWTGPRNGGARSSVAPRRKPRLESSPSAGGEFSLFLGDVVISVETAQRNARLEGHSTAAEIRWLILHGVLHLLGMDHETDHGEMESRELELRARLGLNGSKGVSRTPGRRPRAARRAPAADSPGRKSSGLRNGRRAAGPPQI
ncbi:MAG TPA: rRNA maturation RNase YbeY [Terriglobia bacterium]|nr:rRNA maturation RNase YbeY [Terriglobia bacterium]